MSQTSDVHDEVVRVCWLWFELKMLGYGYTLADARTIWHDEVLPLLQEAWLGDPASAGCYRGLV